MLDSAADSINAVLDRDRSITLRVSLTERERATVLAGGTLRYLRSGRDA